MILSALLEWMGSRAQVQVEPTTHQVQVLLDYCRFFVSLSVEEA
jgi:hypothetical protein